MNTFRFVRVCVTALIAVGTVSLASCSSLDQMANDQAAYNQSQCQKFGLTPGSDAYVRCIIEPCINT